jgi:hypothetical protein
MLRTRDFHIWKGNSNVMTSNNSFFRITVAILAPFIGWEIGFADPNAGPLPLAGILLVLVSLPLLLSVRRDHRRIRTKY